MFDYVPGCTLFDFMEIRDYAPLNDFELKPIVKQLTSTLAKIHQRGIACHFMS